MPLVQAESEHSTISQPTNSNQQAGVNLQQRYFSSAYSLLFVFSAVKILMILTKLLKQSNQFKQLKLPTQSTQSTKPTQPTQPTPPTPPILIMILIYCFEL